MTLVMDLPRFVGSGDSYRDWWWVVCFPLPLQTPDLSGVSRCKPPSVSMLSVYPLLSLTAQQSQERKSPLGS